MIPMSNELRRGYDPYFRMRVSVADTVALDHRLGRAAAVGVIEVVDPWQLPGESSQLTLSRLRYVQTLFEKAALAVAKFSAYTEESMTAYLASPLLVISGGRPALIRKPKAPSATQPYPKIPKRPAVVELSDVTTPGSLI